MALQYECYRCHDLCSGDEVIFIEYYQQQLCSACINDVITSLEIKYAGRLAELRQIQKDYNNVVSCRMERN